jgi:LysR family glycine cleavage system transcriptional activator
MHRTRRLPSLNALRAFESAARHLSFTRSARELGVTQAAVSHQIRALESELGRPLFVRRTRALALTDTGRDLAPKLSRALDAMEEAAALARSGPRRVRLHVSVIPSFAARWLLPRLHRFRTAQPNIDLHVSLSTELVSLARSGFDLGIRWGYGRYPGLAVWPIMDDEVFPVVSPKLLRAKHKFDPARDLPRWGLLHDDRHDHWVEWLERANVRDVQATDGLVFNDASLMLQAAVEGLGIALGRRSLVTEDLRAKRLVRVSNIALPTRESYWLAAPRARAEEPSLRAFRTWLLAEAARS